MFGHCKFSVHCRNYHITTTCSNFPCKDSECRTRLRHPKPCKFFVVYGNCKFGNNCSFLHLPLNNSEKEIETLKDAIKQKDEEILDILSRLTEMEKKIDSLSKSKANSTDKSSNCNFLINDSETLTVHKEKPHDSSSEQVENTKERNLFKCDVCDYESSSKKGVSIHKGSKHRDLKGHDKLATDEEQKLSVSLHPKFKCYLCGEALPTISDLINHNNLNHKGYPKKMGCEECDKICSNIPMLNNHKETEHNLYLCARCNTQFNGRESLDEHIRKQHT